MTNLLLDEKPLIVLPSLAIHVGLTESIILQQLHFWSERSTNVRDGYKWVYNTYEDWVEQFPFWSKSTIRRAITKLENQGLIIVGNFNKLKIDNTKWYRIDYEKLQGMSRPCVQNEQMECSEWTDEVPNLNTPLPEITTESTSKNLEVVVDDPQPYVQTSNPFIFYQENGFGTISSYMSQKISAWCDDLSDELVEEAMKIAVENSSKSWSYVEAILRDWVDKNYQSVEEVRAAQLAYKEQQRKKHKKFTGNRKSIRQEIVPAWLTQPEQQTSGTSTPNPEEEQQLRDRILRYKKQKE